MKSSILIVFALLTCAVAGTQEKPPSLEICSARIHLGMTRPEAESSASGSVILGGKADYWVITTGDPAKSNLLTAVSRTLVENGS
jgi:hypothetical protein